MTPKEVGEHYGRHPETIRRDLRDGRLEGHKGNGTHWEIKDLPEQRPLRRMEKKTCESCHQPMSTRKVLTTVEDRPNGGGSNVVDRHRFCSIPCIKSYIDSAVISPSQTQQDGGLLGTFRRMLSGNTGR